MTHQSKELKQSKEDWKKQISQILVKWDMPTRQVAINEITKLIQSAKEEGHKAGVEEARTRMEKKLMHGLSLAEWNVVSLLLGDMVRDDLFKELNTNKE